jgi:hypothetical protein
MKLVGPGEGSAVDSYLMPKLLSYKGNSLTTASNVDPLLPSLPLISG